VHSDPHPQVYNPQSNVKNVNYRQKKLRVSNSFEIHPVTPIKMIQMVQQFVACMMSPEVKLLDHFSTKDLLHAEFGDSVVYDVLEFKVSNETEAQTRRPVSLGHSSQFRFIAITLR